MNIRGVLGHGLRLALSCISRGGFTMLVCLLLSGCMTMGQQPADRLVLSPSQYTVLSPSQYPALRYYTWLKSASPMEQNAELARLIRKGSSSTVMDTVQLALVLSHVGRDRPDNERRARELLEGIRLDGEHDEAQDYRELGELWETILIQREELRATDDELSSREQRIVDLEENIQALEKQIEELTILEQQINEREQDQ